MVWQSSERKKSVTLNEPMIEELSAYLEKKEGVLGSQLIGSIHTSPSAPSLIDNGSLPPALSQSVEQFERKLHFALQDTKKMSGEEIRHIVNSSLWSYVEVLESCINEFFHQIDQIGFEQWNEEIIQNAIRVKEVIKTHLATLKQAISKIETVLRTYQNDSLDHKRNLFKRLISNYLDSILDHSIKTSIEKCGKSLNFNFQKFIEEYQGYLELKQPLASSQNQFYNYPVFLSLELSSQIKFKKLCFLLKIWKLNQSAKVLRVNEPIRALRGLGTPDYLADLFIEYFLKINQAVFEKSRLIKTASSRASVEILDLLTGYQKELWLLQTSICSYKKFVLSTDLHYYLHRSGNKWRHWFCSQPETRVSKQLDKSLILCEQLKRTCSDFKKGLDKEKEQTMTPQRLNEIGRCLHEMGQPLASREWMKSHVKSFVRSVLQLNELASSDPQVVNYMSLILCKALREDWKYHALIDSPLFVQIYETHKNIIVQSVDKVHVKRLNNLQRVLSQLSEWIKTGESFRRLHEVELDIGDIKTYLQSFYAELQYIEQNPESEKGEEKVKSLHGLRENLLQYLYLFALFFHGLPADKPEGQLIRQQLLFVDQYFDAIGEKLEELIINE